MQDGLAEILSGTLPAYRATRYRLRSAIIFDDLRMIDRDVSGTVFEISHGIATLEHQLAYQPLRLHDHTAWVINKARLKQSPFLRESCRLRRRQRHEFESLNTRFPRFELGLSPLSIPDRPDDATVLRTESLLQTSGLRSLAFACYQNNRADDCQHE